MSSNTIRRWCKQFADHLSPEANARPRTLNDQDIAILEYVAACRKDGMPWVDIDQRLTETTLTPGEIVLPEASHDIAPDVPHDAPGEQIPPEAIQAPALLLQAHTDALQRLTARLEQRHDVEVRAIADQVSRLQTWLLITIAVVVVLVVAVVAGWVVG